MNVGENMKDLKSWSINCTEDGRGSFVCCKILKVTSNFVS